MARGSSKTSLLKIILGILFFPITLTILILKTKAKLLVKLGLIAVLWVFFFIVGASSPDETPPSDDIPPSSYEEQIPSSTPVEDSTDSKSEETPPPQEDPVEEEQPSAPIEPEKNIPEASTFSIHFIDVGQADAALIECDEHYMLIDGGNKADSNVIYSVLKKAAVPKLDIVVGTHAHEDHIGGLPGAFNYTSADITLSPVTSYDSNAFDDFAKYASQKGGGITVPSVGDTYSLGSSSVTILGVNGGSDTNDTSIVLRIDYGETSFLFTGDAEYDAEKRILNSGANLSATVLKVGHHGSDTSTNYTFLREIMPQYAVISVGEDNSYGHPTEATLSRLRDAEVKVFRTDLQGDIFCTSDGKTVTFSVERNANADTLSTQKKQTSTPTVTQPVTPPASTDDASSDVAGSYIGNKNTKKFHIPSCSSLPKEHNRVYFNSRQSAIDANYDPCGRCHP